jgi:hypothetical protein
MAKPSAKAKKSKTCIVPIGITEPSDCRKMMLNVPVPLARAAATVSATRRAASALPANPAVVACVICPVSVASCVRK